MIFNDDHSAPLCAIDDCALQEGKKIVVILCFLPTMAVVGIWQDDRRRALTDFCI